MNYVFKTIRGEAGGEPLLCYYVTGREAGIEEDE